MSVIGEMNREIRFRAQWSAIFLLALGALAVSPESSIELLRGNFRDELWWAVLVAGVLFIWYMVEALDIGRHPSHRGTVNALITKEIIGQMCDWADCPQKESPSGDTRRAALGVFYGKIDSASREVAFNHWGWYYSSILIAWEAGVVFVPSVLLSFRIDSDLLDLRLTSLATQLGILVTALVTRKIWEDKTVRHAKMQLLQIQPQLSRPLAGLECRHSQCPLK